MIPHSPTLLTDLDVSLDHQTGHILLAGNSGSGKTGALCLIARQKLCNPLMGFIGIDPEGEISQHCAEYLANPAHGLGWRKVHYLKPASSTDAFALPILHVPDRSPQKAHDAALRALTIFEQAVTVGAGDYGPRLSKFFYLGALGLALSGRSLCDLPDLYGSSGRGLRDLTCDAYPYPFLRDAMQVVDDLSPRAILEYKDPLISRLMPIFGNAQLRRVFGPQPPLDIAAVLRNREVVLLDLSGLEHKDAVLVGKAFASLVYHEAVQRQPNLEPHTCLMLDEAFDYLAPLVRGFDRLRKRNVQLCIAVQRFAQLQKAADDDAAAALSAVVSGTNTKLVFRLPEPDDADFMTNVLFRGFVDLEEWKAHSARPTAIGNRLEILRNWSEAHHEAEHESHAHTQSHAHGESVGTMASTSIGTGDFSASGDSAGLVLTPPTQFLGPNAPTATFLPVPQSQSTGESNSRGSSNQQATSSGTSHVAVDMHAEAVTHGVGLSRGVSRSEGAAEAWVTQYAELPTQMFSLPEQLHRLAGEIQNLDHRECFVKIHNRQPVRTRTCDLAPAFKSAYGRRVLLPLFHERVVARSGYLFPVAAVDAQIAARLSAVLTPSRAPEPDVAAPEPLTVPIVDDPDRFARAFWKKRTSADAAKALAKKAKPRVARTPAPPSPTHPTLRLIDGGKGDKDGGGDNSDEPS